MKIAIMFGKGLDGCGVQRGGVEMQNWCLKNGIECDIFSLVERKFARAAGHVMARPPIEFKPDRLMEIGQRLEEYDIVLFNSYPSHKHSHSTAIAFFNMLRTLEKPILVAMMHEIKQMNIDCYPFIIPILNYCDIIYNFSEKTWFAKRIAEVLPSKQLGVRTKRFKLWTDVSQFEKYRSTPRNRRLTYVGRWTTMKDPRRVLDLYDTFKEVDPTFQLAIHGIERSIGAKYDIIEHPNCRYSEKYDTQSPPYDFDKPGVPVFGPFTHADGMRYISESMFVSSFFRLPDEPWNYGDRMEYTQIEIIACGSIPVFDKHYGENNFTDDGTPYIKQVPAVWSDKSDLPQTVEQILELADKPALQEYYKERGLAFVKREFDSDSVLPVFFDEIKRIGKDENKFKDDKDMLFHWFSVYDAHAKYNKLMMDGIAPAVGFKQIETRQLCKFVGKGRVLVEDYSPKALSKKEAKADLSSFF